MSTKQKKLILTLIGIVLAVITLAALLFGGGDQNLQGTAAQLPTATTANADVAPTVPPTETPVTPEGQPEDSSTEIIAEQPIEPTPEEPTGEPTSEPTDDPTDEAAAPATDAPTQSPTAEPEIVSTIEIIQPTQTQQPATGGNQPRVLPAACQLNITDAGDTNPFTFSFTATGREITTYTWDVNAPSGTDFTGAGPHTFTYPTVGTYDITLNCLTTSGATLTPTGKINIQSVVTANFEVTPGLSGVKPFSIYLLNKSTGANLTHQWTVTGPSFSDSSTLANPAFVLPNAGNYTITLQVTDGAGTTQSASATVVVLEPQPEADFSADPTTGEAPLIVTFNGIDLGAGPITSWSWDFDNGQTASTQGPHTITFNAEGNYDVRLDYSGPGGSGYAIKRIGVFPGGADVQAIFDYYFTGRDVGAGNVEVCFNNKSTGPVDVAEWDFSYAAPTFNVEYSGTDSPVCRTITGVGVGINITVRLEVRNADGTRTSNATETVLVTSAPIAAFTITPNPVTWGNTVSFNNTSSGSIDTYEWDFNNDGVIDSTDENPTNINISTIGNNIIRLTVKGPGGTSTTEGILRVERRDITCSVTGNFAPVPNTAQTYTASVGNLSGRTPTITWSIDGPGFSQTGSANTISATFVNAGAYVITLTATTADGATCTTSRTVQVQYTDPTCALTGNFTPYPDGTGYNYTVSVTDPLTPARTPVMYEWFINGVSQGAPTAGASTFTRSWASPTTETIRVEAVVTNPDGSKTGCAQQRTLNVIYPPLSCSIANITSGASSPVPTMPDATRQYTYEARVTAASLAGRTITGYTWSWSPASISGVVSPVNRLTLEWLWNQTGVTNVNVVIRVNDPSAPGGYVECNPTRALNVQLQTLTCNAVSGDLTPTINDSVTYTRNISNRYGRTIYESGFKLEIEDPINSGTYVLVQENNFPLAAAADVSSMSYMFTEAARRYRLSYFVKLLNPDGTNGPQCARQFDYITTPGSGTALFDCEGWNTTDFTLNPLATNKPFRVNVDNSASSPALPLAFDWEIRDYTGAVVHSGTTNSAVDGIVTLTTLNGAAFAFSDNQYTLDVSVRDTSGTTAYTCAYPQRKLTVGSINVNFTPGGSTAWDIATPVCLTNTSSTAHDPTGNALTYTWDFGTAANSTGAQTSTDKTPTCFTFDAPGTYTVQLTGTTASGQMTASRSYTFNVYGSQKIGIDYNGADFPFTGVMNFTAIKQNITSALTWTFKRPDGTTFTRTGDARTEALTMPGVWEVTVTGSGPLGSNSATVSFELIATDNIRAAFTPSTYGGLADLTICFNDGSAGNNINSWEWDFNGDGVIDLAYSTPPATPPCYTYTQGGQEYPVRLFIQNASGKTAQATNRVRTYNLVEARATFTVAAQGAGQYCFTPVVDAGINVTGWEFGDGQMSPVTGYVCYSYSYSGTFLVTMNIESSGVTGKIQRPVVVVFGPPAVPNVAATGSCVAWGQPTFTITNTGDNMATTDRVTIRNSAGTIVLTDDTLKLNTGESRTYTLNNVYGAATLTLLDNTSVTANTYCNVPPTLTASNTCAADGSATFTITNSSTDLDANQPYEVRDASNALVQSGTISVPRNGGTATVTVSGYHGALTFTSTGPEGATTALTSNSACAQPPVISAAGVCQINGTAVFTVTNSSTATNANQPYTVTDSTGATIDSGTITAAANGGTQTITINNVYGPLTFSTASSTQGVTTQATANTDCDMPPTLSVNSTCAADGSTTFTITNTSTDLDANQPYEVRDASNTVVDSGTLSVPRNGGTTTVTISGYQGALTFTSSGTQGATTVISANSACAQPPVISAAGVCQIDGSAVFTVTNTSIATDANQPYTVTDSTGATIDSGTITAAANGGTQTVTINNVYGPLTFTTGSSTQGVTTQATANTDCDVPPTLTGSATCDVQGTAAFKITNSGEVAANQPYTITDNNGAIVSSGTLKLNAGATDTIRVAAQNGPLTFSTSGAQGATTVLNLNTVCEPILGGMSITSICEGGSATFTIVNSSTTPFNQPYQVVDAAQTLITSGTLDIAAGETATVTVPVETSNLTLVSSGAVNLLETSDCSDSDVFSPRPTITSYFNIDPTPRDADTTTVERPAWDAIGVGGGDVCVDWLLYHTDQTGDWEIFRLGDEPRYPNADPNLSQSSTSTDLMPSRSPDKEWVAFSSDRDGNWELYITRVDNTITRRLTYNTTARDLDPMWSPDGRSIVFESDRNGNWDLYLFDIATGEERRLTDSFANEQNAFWSPDAQQIAFQSDESGLWQIYIMDIATGETTRVSDGQGEDIEPAFSFKGDQIAFRSARENDSATRIYVMNADGSNVTAITPADAMASNHTWYVDDSIIAYQSDLDGDYDIYVYEFATGKTRLVTDNTIHDYAPTWLCAAPIVIFTSDITGDSNIFSTPALPMDAPAILVEEAASRLTSNPTNDIYPENTPSEENASLEVGMPIKFAVP